MLNIVPADESIANMKECQVDVVAPFVADLQTTKAGKPTNRPLHHPAIASQPLGGINPSSSNARQNASSAQRCSLLSRVIRFVCMKFLGSSSGPPSFPSDRDDCIYGCLQHSHIMDIRRRGRDRQRDALAFDQKMALRARFAAICRIRPVLEPPRGQAPPPNPKKHVTS